MQSTNMTGPTEPHLHSPFSHLAAILRYLPVVACTL